MITVILPWPPSVNHYWQACGHRRFIARAGVEFRDHVLARVGGLYEPFEGAVKLKIEAYPPDRRRRDLDNLLKALMDSLQYAGVYEDDFQVGEIHICRREVSKPGRVAVTISYMDVKNG